ncbi:MAG: EAL domain-containing protein [Acetobacteraceae bacterium]|nr:EAL domain-containing protein [Acetobacteraceae bacterium]
MSGREPDAGLTRLVTAFAALVSLLLAVAAPAIYYWAAHAREVARAHAQGGAIARDVSEMVARNPDLWQFERARIVALLANRQINGAVAMQQVLGPDGRLIAEHPVDVPHPRLLVSDPVLDAGRPVAVVRTIHPARAILIETAIVALGAGLLALLAFLALRSIPLRALTAALQRAAHLANYDTLTGLPNRALFHQRLQHAMALAQRKPHCVSVLCLDLDHFKDVNDTLGHPAGDKLLAQVAARLNAVTRESDTVARLGGDEFAIVQIGMRQPEDAETLARRLVETLAEPFDLDGHRAVIGASIGIAIAQMPGTDAARLLREADLALYQTKAEGRGAYCFFEVGMNERLFERKRLESDLREAVAAGQFRLHYQPLVEFRSEPGDPAVIGAEALIRWHHPERGNVRPDQFIPLAEATGLIVPIGEWALREACRQASGWPARIGVAVNVSPVQFRNAGFVDAVAAALRDSGLPAARLELEITEGVLLTDTEDTLLILERLRAIGVRIAMDDFGTGYSSLGYLRRFRFDKIKIDGSFVRHLGSGNEAEAIVRAVVGMGQAMGIRVNAEGVETDTQADLLRIEGCGEMQGYLFGRPMPSEEFEAVLAERAQPSALAA